MKYFLPLIIILLAINTRAQSITGTVSNEAQEAVEFATISLIKLPSQEFVAGSISHEGGAFAIDQELAKGNYQLEISYIGYQKYTQELSIDNQPININASLASQEVALQTVSAQSKRPKIKRVDDHYIVTFSAAQKASNSTIDLLRFAPGVVVTPQEKIKINRQSAHIFIDEQELRLAGSQRTEYLQSINNEDIKSIEVYPNPAASADAAGAGGIIKIKLKQAGNNEGFGGYFNYGYDQGEAAGTNAGLGLSYNKNKISMYATYAPEYTQPISQTRVSNQPDNSDFNSQTEEEKRQEYLTQNARAGLEYRISPKHNLVLGAEGNFSHQETKSASSTSQQYRDQETSTIIVGNFPEDNRDNAYGANLNYAWAISPASKLLFVADYYNLGSNSKNLYQSSYYSGYEPEEVLYQINRKSTYDYDLDISTSKLDYSHTFNQKTTLGIGAKYGHINNHSDNVYYREVSNQWVADSSQTDLFRYKEDIYAGYLQVSSAINKLDYRIGLRTEYVQYTTQSSSSELQNKDHYTKFFPSLYMGYPIGQSKLEFNYTTRILRPQYALLNPFEYYINEYTVEEGNANLQPSYTHNLAVNYLVHSKYNLTLGYSHQHNAIGEYSYQDGSEITHNSYKNLDKYQSFYTSLYAPFNIKEWWHTDLDLYLGYNKNNEENYRQNSFIMDLSFNNQFTIIPTLTAELNFSFSPKGAVYYYQKTTTNINRLDVTVNKSIFRGRADIGLYAEDLLHKSGRYTIESQYQGSNIVNQIEQDSRRYIGVYFRFKFYQGSRYDEVQEQKSNLDELDRS